MMPIGPLMIEHRLIERMIKVVECLESLVDFYPKHIEKEDRRFFLPVMGYFTHEEKNAMLAEGYTFDREFIHEKYRMIVEASEEWGVE